MIVSDNVLMAMLLLAPVVALISLSLGTGDKAHHSRNQAIILYVCVICFVFPLVEFGFFRKGAWFMGMSLMIGVVVLPWQFGKFKSKPVLVASGLAVVVPVVWFFAR